MHLRRFERADFNRLISEAISPELLYQWTGGLFTYPLDVRQLERYLLTAIGDPPTTRLFTALDEAGAPVGHIELARIDRRNRCASVARVLIYSERRGQGLGAELLRQALRIAFEELGLHRVELNVFDFNQPAIAAYRQAGMVVEGHMRDVHQVGQVFWSVYHMSMLENEWRGRANPRPAPIA